MTTTEQIPHTTTTTSRLRKRWPTIAGVVLAAFIGYDLVGGADLAPVLAASGLVYLGAAALGRPSAAWPLFLGTFAVITVNEIVGGPDPAWTFLVLAVPLAAYGLVRGRGRDRSGLPLQGLAMVGLAIGVAGALLIGGTFGAYLVAAGLLGHAAWDVYHHRINRVVVRSMAEFCVVLDTLLAVAILVTTVRG